MLTGLIIATHDAADRPGMLTATLPFGGVTLIEYQARLLIGAGVSQVVIMVARLTPELMGAINRIGRRGTTVDTVRSPAEAFERLHPLSRVLMMADGLSTTPEVVAMMAREGSDALLVVAEEAGDGSYERIGGGLAWAGIARLDPARHRQLDDLERLAKPLAVLAQRPVVGIALVRLDRRDDRAGGDKTGDVVNMPVRVVALDAVAEPSDPLDTKMVA